MAARARPEALTPTRPELLAALSLAIDLGLGLPAEHVLRSALMAARLARLLGGDDHGQEVAYSVTLVMWVGCHAESHEYSRWFGDDIAVRRDSYDVDWTGVPYAIFLLQNLGRGRTLPQRLKVASSLLRDPRANLATMTRSHCSSAALLARRIGLDDDVQHALGSGFERWDGGGLPDGTRGAGIPLAMRIAQVVDLADVVRTRRGAEAALDVLAARSGGQLDPDVVACFARHHEELFTLPPDVWSAAVTQAPGAQSQSVGADPEDLIAALGDFVDLKSPYTVGHSRSVAGLAAAAGRHLGLPDPSITRLRRAGHLHDLGRIGISNLIWEKATPLSVAERERVELHPFLTGRILARLPGLEAEAHLAVNHHERLDGSGYPGRLRAAELTVLDQVLAAADLYQCAVEAGPGRAAAGPDEAARMLRAEAREGRLHAEAVDAVLHAAGRSSAKPVWPAGLTAREVEVLRLVARATPTPEVALRLSITEKTVRHHLEHIYAKTGASSRVALSLFATDHGLV
jgi:HD-GYP domain-containing protein (c-di-GMP phosphodiesterase class II)